MYMVFYDDQDCLYFPLVWDADCEGALCSSSAAVSTPVIFPDRRSAQQAITISAAFARLREAQGLPANTDFTTSRKNVVIRKCVLAAQTGG